MTDPSSPEDLDALLADPPLDVDDEGQVVCMSCDVVLGPVASVGPVTRRIREHLGR